MYPALTTFVTLLMSPSSTWIGESSQECLQQIMAKFFSNDSQLIMSDSEFPKPLISARPVMILATQMPPINEKLDVVLVYQKLSDWPGKKLQGRVIFLTQSLEAIDSLWTKFRLLNLIVLLQTNTEVKVYGWFPYSPKYCWGKPVLELMDTWRDGKFQNGSDFARNRLPTQFSKCPLKCSTAICPPFAARGYRGPEIDVLRDLLFSVKLTFLPSKIPDYKIYFADVRAGKITPKSAFYLLTTEDTELATTCLIKTLENIEFDTLPSHMTDSSVWFLPGPIPITLRFGFAQALPKDIWAAIGITFLACLLFPLIMIPSRSSGFIFSWTTARLFALPYPELSSKISIKLFSVILELCILVISTVYRSLLLLNLFSTPIFQIETAEEGLRYGLKVWLRATDRMYINQSNHGFWNEALKPGRHEMGLLYNYKQIIVNKSAMLLGRRIVDHAMILDQFPNITFEDAIYIDKHSLNNIDLVFFLRPNHPLTPILTEKMLTVIEAGLPAFYIKRTFAELIHRVEETGEKPDQVLSISQLRTFFYLFLFLLFICCIMFILELSSLMCKPKKKLLGLDHRRHNQRLRTLDFN